MLKSILQGWGSGPSALADLDTTQDAIERGNAALLAEHGAQLVDLISVDALNTSAPALQQAVALHLIGALVAADTRAGVAGAAHAQGVPQQLLHLLATVPQVRKACMQDVDIGNSSARKSARDPMVKCNFFANIMLPRQG